MPKISGPINLALCEIAAGDTRFRISEAPPPARLISSIRAVGLLQPPLVARRGGTWVIVSGWKRVLACRALGMRTIPVTCLEAATDREALLVAVRENGAFRDFSPMESAAILARLLSFDMPASEVRSVVMPLLGIPPTEAYLGLYRKLARFSPAVRGAMADHNLGFPVLRLLAEFHARDADAVLPLLLPLGQNKQKEILDHLREIGRKKRMSARRILALPSIVDILGSTKWPDIQKSERVRRELRRIRYPRLSSWEDEFRAAVRELGWPAEIGIEPAPFFETDDMTATFRFRNSREFAARAGKLREIANRRSLEKLWSHAPKSTAAGAPGFARRSTSAAKARPLKTRRD
jgi:ParB family chromosome partitioning protein